MLIQKRLWEPIRLGEITIIFRRWKRPQVVAGRIYRTAAGRLAVSDVRPIKDTDVTELDATRAGYESAAGVVEDLRGEPTDLIYRVEFTYLNEPDPRTELANQTDLSDAEVAELDRRLARLDAHAKNGPWTWSTLKLIEAHPERRAPDLADMAGRETASFKTDVRKLKNLGLTLSFRIGYRLSPRGETYLRRQKQGAG